MPPFRLKTGDFDAVERGRFQFDMHGSKPVWFPYMRIEIEQEEDGRWLTEIPEMPGVMVYGATRDEAVARVKALALRVLADRLEHGGPFPSWWKYSR